MKSFNRATAATINTPRFVYDIQARVLKSQDIYQILEVQKIILDALPAHKKHFIATRSKDGFLKFIQSQGNILGLFDNEKLIAYSIVDFPKHISETQFDPSIQIDDINKSALFKSTVVVPEYRGQNLQKILIDMRVECALEAGRDVFITEVDPQNQASLSSLISQGFYIKHLGVSPADGMTSLYLFKENKVVAPKNLKMVSLNDLGTHIKLLNNNHVGIAIDHGFITYSQL
tara:strand:+ start:122758 stop:123450 length:693 start_codon:yes stop_codon:yes gene_type:complete